jgi:hypothetical protein
VTVLLTCIRQALFLLRGSNRWHGHVDERTARSFYLLLTAILIWVCIARSWWFRCVRGTNWRGRLLS